MDASLLTFLGISAAMVVRRVPTRRSPYETQFLDGRHGGILTGGRELSAGQVVWSVGTSLGLLAVLLTSETVFHAVKLLGAAYLGHTLASSRCALRFGARIAAWLEPPRDARARLGGLAAFPAGPPEQSRSIKMAVFFARRTPAVRPRRGTGSVRPRVARGGVLPSSRSCGSSMRWLWLRPAEFVRGSRVRRAIDGTAGVALIGLGVSVATEGR